MPQFRAATVEPHVFVTGNVMRCDYCGVTQVVTLPQPIFSVVAVMKAFTQAHDRCPAPIGAGR